MGMKGNSKKRGRRTGGFGRIGGHRKHPGGRGRAGASHHRLMSSMKYSPVYYGKIGMRRGGSDFIRVSAGNINIEKIVDLSSIINTTLRSETSNKSLLIDFERVGVRKVIGNGVFKNEASLIYCREFSSNSL